MMIDCVAICLDAIHYYLRYTIVVKIFKEWEWVGYDGVAIIGTVLQLFDKSLEAPPHCCRKRQSAVGVEVD